MKDRKKTTEEKKEEAKFSKWFKELKRVQESRAQKAFERNGEKIVKDYRNAQAIDLYDVKKSLGRVMFNILWANVQTLKPALYSGMPDIVIERLFKDVDPVGRMAGYIAERATKYVIESQEDAFNFAILGAVEDRLLPGRGQVWVRYDADFEEVLNEQGEPVMDPETGQPIKQVAPNSEKVCIDYVHWQDYFESAARTPYEICWKARRVYLSENQLVEKFGEVGKLVKLGVMDEEPEFKKNEMHQTSDQAEVFEIWDKDTKTVYWLSPGYRDGLLKELKDPLRLKGFFPCPIPLLSTTTSDSTYPTPDFKIYESLAQEYDDVTKRESSLIDCIRFVGATAAQFNKDIKNMLSLRDGSLWPVENWASFAEHKGFEGMIDWLPFNTIVDALPALANHKISILNQIYEITGIPDIARGVTDPEETLGAQKRKLRSMGTKTEEKARDVARFIREVYSKCCEIIFEPGLFSDQTIGLMCGYEQMSVEDQGLFLPALQILRNDRLRTFRVSVETTTTADEEMERDGRMEFLNALNQVISNMQQLSQLRPELLQPLIESAQFALASFKNGRAVTGALEQAWKQIELAQKEAAQNPPPPPFDYQAQVIEVEAKKAEGDFRIQSEKLMLEGQKMQLENEKARAEFELEAKKLDIEAQKVFTKAEFDKVSQELSQFKEQFSQFIQTKNLELEQYRIVLQEKEKIIEEARLANQKAFEQEKKEVLISLNKRPKRKVAKVSRLPDGSLVGESYEVGDEGRADNVKQVVLNGNNQILS